MDYLSEKIVKRIFIFFLIYLPLQYAVVGIVGYYSSEPWPAFVFPGFKSIYVYGDTYQINQFMVEVESPDGTVLREFAPQQFFYEIPNSQVTGFLRSNLDGADDFEAFDTETRNWFRERAQALVGVSPGDLYYLHRRQYMTRFDNKLNIDSVKVLNRFKIAEGNL
jgi:hypothetical protein